MNKDIVTPPKKGLKTRHYSKDMNMDNNVATLPKKEMENGKWLLKERWRSLWQCGR